LKVEYQNTETASILERLIYGAKDFHTIAELNVLLKKKLREKGMENFPVSESGTRRLLKKIGCAYQVIYIIFS